MEKFRDGISTTHDYQIKLSADFRCLWGQIKRNAASALVLTALLCYIQVITYCCFEFQLQSLCTFCRHCNSLLKVQQQDKQHISIIFTNFLLRSEWQSWFSYFHCKISLWSVFKSEKQEGQIITERIISLSKRRLRFGAFFFYQIPAPTPSCFSSAHEMRSHSSHPRALCTRRCTTTEQLCLSQQGNARSHTTTDKPFNPRNIRHELCKYQSLTGRNLRSQLQEHKSGYIYKHQLQFLLFFWLYSQKGLGNLHFIWHLKNKLFPNYFVMLV